MKYVIYNFAGFPGDLYQLVPDKFLATLCTALNREEPGSAQVWDRCNLRDVQALAPAGGPAWLMRECGHRLFRHVRESGRVPKALGLMFRGANALADRALRKASRRIVRQDAQAIRDAGAQAVFINLRHGPGFSESLELAGRIKQESPATRVVAIGHRASWFCRELAALYPQFDAFVVGPSSYRTMRALAAGVHPAMLKNVAYRDGRGDVVVAERDFTEESDDALVPDYSPDVYVGAQWQLPFREVVLANEACPFACHFCIRPVTYGTKWRARDVSAVVDEVERHARVDGIRCFRFSDSTPPPGMLTAVAREILARGLQNHGLYISSFGRLNRRMREDYGLLREAGFRALFFGVESGSQRMLDEVLGKKITVQEVKETVRQVYAAGIAPVTSFIFPAPGETEATRQETLDLLAEIKPYIASALVQPAGVYPETPWHKDPKRFGVRLEPDYVRRAVTYPIEPLKPLRFWRPFPFSYDLMGRPAEAVAFADIARCFSAFTKSVWEAEENGGLGIANVQDYGIVLAQFMGLEPAAFSQEVLLHLVTRNVDRLKAMMVSAGAARDSWPPHPLIEQGRPESQETPSLVAGE